MVVISQTLARRYWPDTDPVGQRMNFSWGPGDEQEIIGVVGDVRHDGLNVAVAGMMYRPITQFAFPVLTLVVHTEGEPTTLIDGVRAQVRSLDPTLPVDGVMTLREVVRSSVSARSTLMVLLTGFAAIALLLAAVGVYAITAQSVGQRRSPPSLLSGSVITVVHPLLCPAAGRRCARLRVSRAQVTPDRLLVRTRAFSRSWAPASSGADWSASSRFTAM